VLPDALPLKLAAASGLEWPSDGVPVRTACAGASAVDGDRDGGVSSSWLTARPRTHKPAPRQPARRHGSGWRAGGRTGACRSSLNRSSGNGGSDHHASRARLAGDRIRLPIRGTCGAGRARFELLRLNWWPARRGTPSMMQELTLGGLIRSPRR
jgi:hypothetical protein